MLRALVLPAAALVAAPVARAVDPNPAVPLMTIWGETGVPEPNPAYPRPLLVRPDSSWASLNG